MKRGEGSCLQFPSLLYLQSTSCWVVELQKLLDQVFCLLFAQMSSQMFFGTDRTRVKFDLKFTETINQYMQVPSRLKIVEESGAAGDGLAKDDRSPSFHMHIPDRISLADVEMMEVGLKPFQLDQRQWRSSPFTLIPLRQSSHVLRSSELPFVKTAATSGTSNPNKLNRSQKFQLTDTSPATRGAISQRTGLPSVEDDGVCRTLAVEKLHPHSTPPQLRTLDLDHNTSDKSVEDLGLMEVIAMRKLLIKISGRLQSLEEERASCYQKEILIYSALLTACLINTLLWLRR